MSKRLLRYALSRLEFLDTDALDLDKLDLAWGVNNVLTFQDVGIKLQACNRPSKPATNDVTPRL
jgi:autophagy-related protein 2